jgi:Ca2+-binding EF-hand superfamily protein
MTRASCLILAIAFATAAWAADKENPKKPAENPEVEKIVADLLQRFDTNKDGKISKDEAKGRLADAFGRFDTNKDGFLDKDELRRVATFMIAQRNGPGGLGPGAPGREPDFDDLDRNADGRLTREELKGTPFAEHFDEIDTNKDGKIDKKEFQAYLRKQAEKKKEQTNGK